MSAYIVDIEADGPIPGPYSMIEIGAVRLTEDLEDTFFAQIRPISKKYMPEKLAITGHTRKDTLDFKFTASQVMSLFNDWIKESNKKGSRPMFFSDNNGFDYMFTHWYFMKFLEHDPFGWSSNNLQNIFKGMKKDFRNRQFKKLRKTKHDHNPVNDAIGNAEVLKIMIQDMGLKGLIIE